MPRTDTSSITRFGTVTAESKLPDDLLLEEYVDIVAAMNTLALAADDIARRSAVYAQESRPNFERTEILKAQYGSDFLVIISIASASAGVAGAIAGAFAGFAKGMKIIAEARAIEEDRLGKKEQRLRRRQKGAEARRAINRPAPGHTIDVGALAKPDLEQIQSQKQQYAKWEQERIRAIRSFVSSDEQQELNRAAGAPLPASAHIALVTLVEYQVQLSVEAE